LLAELVPVGVELRPVATHQLLERVCVAAERRESHAAELAPLGVEGIPLRGQGGLAHLLDVPLTGRINRLGNGLTAAF